MVKEVVNIVAENQKILENGLYEDLVLSPLNVRQFFTSNFLQRTLSQLKGWTGNHSILLRCTASGYLYTSNTGTIFQHNISKAGNAPDAYGAAIDYGRIVSRLDVFTWNFACLIKTSLDNVTYDDEFEVPANFFYSFDKDVRYFKIVNKVALSVCRYSIVGYY